MPVNQIDLAPENYRRIGEKAPRHPFFVKGGIVRLFILCAVVLALALLRSRGH